MLSDLAEALKDFDIQYVEGTMGDRLFVLAPDGRRGVFLMLSMDGSLHDLCPFRWPGFVQNERYASAWLLAATVKSLLDSYKGLDKSSTTRENEAMTTTRSNLDSQVYSFSVATLADVLLKMNTNPDGGIKKISATKALRELTQDLGLKEAKDAIDAAHARTDRSRLEEAITEAEDNLLAVLRQSDGPRASSNAYELLNSIQDMRNRLRRL